METPTLAERFKPILDRYSPFMDELRRAGITYRVSFWTPLKLYVLASYVHTCYLKILKSPKLNLNLYYLDLLSNSGINEVSDCKDCLNHECDICKRIADKPYYFPGSPLLAASAGHPFAKMYLMERDPKKCDALKERIRILSSHGICQSPTSILEGDSNTNIDRVLEEITDSKRFHFLAFVDNSGFDIKWATVEKMLKQKWCDMIINYPTSNAKRAIGQRKADFDLRKAREFFGMDSIEDLNEGQLLTAYTDRIKGLDKHVEPIHINTGIGYTYDLLIVTKTKPGFGGYIQGLKSIIERSDATQVRNALAILSNKQDTLKKYL